MNTQNLIKSVVVIMGIMASGWAFAHGAGEIGPTDSTPDVSLIYTNAAYTHAIHGAPNPAPEVVVGQVAPIYVNQSAGPAIYSYPGTVNTEPHYLCER